MSHLRNHYATLFTMSVGRTGESLRFFPHRSHVSGKRQIRFAQRIEENLLLQVDILSAELCVPSHGNDDLTRVTTNPGSTCALIGRQRRIQE